ncbi:MAG: TIGR02996 domain-containing protein [Deltaproteobacteria bacterium]|nr:TIGR02996 domain-containing protein [Deltaproteobacteria bacterium]MCW5803534.1 TIGR02996 domain-containing protein [Deltaproteobacteria bacterium]
MTWAAAHGSLILRPERAPIGADERRMLDAVLADPDDDAPRLVYADWLMARPEPELAARGELIVVQCALETMQDPAEHNRLKARDFELVERFGNRWAAQTGIGVVRNNFYRSPCGVELRRGFIEAATALTDDFAGFASRLFTREPVRELTLIGESAHIARVPTSLFVARLRALAIREAHGSVAHLAALASSPHVAGLERLDLSASYRALRDEPIAALARAGSMPRLRELVLAKGHIGPAGAHALAAAPLTTNLTRLVLDGNPIDDDGALAFVDSPHLAQLRELSLVDVMLGQDVRARLARRFGGGVRFD